MHYLVFDGREEAVLVDVDADMDNDGADVNDEGEDEILSLLPTEKLSVIQ
jgi:hypothetical protein